MRRLGGVVILGMLFLVGPRAAVAQEKIPIHETVVRVNQWPPRVSAVINLAGSVNMPEGDRLAWTVPSGLHFMLTDVFITGSNTVALQIGEIVGAQPYVIKYQAGFLEPAKRDGEELSGTDMLGLVFKPDAKVIFHAANGGFNGSFMLIGYLFTP